MRIFETIVVAFSLFSALPMPKVGPDFHACYNALPYTITGAQQRVIKEIRADLMSGPQMNRLLQGDVGSGKTMVAVLSCLMAIGNGFQTCIMAPTEVLAQQHYANIQKYLKPTSVQCALLTGSTPQKERRAIHAALEDGSLGILVGTHALLEDNVVFRRLGLAVIDEQHRFGVDQRSKLWSKGPLAEGAPASLDFASLIPPTASQRVPPVHEATGGHASRRQSATPVSAAAGRALADADFMGVPMTELKKGQRIEHNRFGPGTILELSGSVPDMKAKIRFDAFGEKLLLLKYAKIRPLQG